MADLFYEGIQHTQMLQYLLTAARYANGAAAFANRVVGFDHNRLDTLPCQAQCDSQTNGATACYDYRVVAGLAGR